MKLAVTNLTQIGAARYRYWGAAFYRFVMIGDVGNRF